jgi:hypothetical protein
MLLPNVKGEPRAASEQAVFLRMTRRSRAEAAVRNRSPGLARWPDGCWFGSLRNRTLQKCENCSGAVLVAHNGDQLPTFVSKLTQKFFALGREPLKCIFAGEREIFDFEVKNDALVLVT